MQCPGSLRECAKVPPLPDSAYSAEGTHAHGVLDQVLQKGTLDLQADCNGDEDLHAALRIAVDAVEAEKARFVEIELFGVERTVTPLASDPTTRGTADVLIAGRLSTGKRAVTVLDYKHGKNVPVGPSSAQLLAYGLGGMAQVGGWVHSVRTVVVQPRLRMKLPPVRSVDHNIESMRSFAAALLATCQLADTPDAPLQPSTSACRWCAAREVCPAKARAPKKVDADFAALIGAG
jgi:RecB family exonuclease